MVLNINIIMNPIVQYMSYNVPVLFCKYSLVVNPGLQWVPDKTPQDKTPQDKTPQTKPPKTKPPKTKTPKTKTLKTKTLKTKPPKFRQILKMKLLVNVLFISCFFTIQIIFSRFFKMYILYSKFCSKDQRLHFKSFISPAWIGFECYFFLCFLKFYFFSAEILNLSSDKETFPGHFSFETGAWGVKECVLYGTKQHRTSVIFLVLWDTLGTMLIRTVFFCIPFTELLFNTHCHKKFTNRPSRV